ncbi:uncharacterized protein LOC106471252, partial [Limulus polyphemus]|uniref:Uncharacterized protein LOC106471252 n=1 Tax=Limulus polyphemus TaxID=6850 RepID=A0ABM1BRK4_LIMPO
MLGVLRRHWKPKRSAGERKKKGKDKSTLDGGREVSNNSKETTRLPRIVRDVRQVHPHELDKLNVIGTDCTIVVTSNNDHWDSSKKNQKDTVIRDLENRQKAVNDNQKHSIKNIKSNPVGGLQGSQDADSCMQKNSNVSVIKYQNVEKEENAQFFENSVPLDERSSKNVKDSSGSEKRDVESSLLFTEDKDVAHNMNGGSIDSDKNVEKHLNDFYNYANANECDDKYWFEKSGEDHEEIRCTDDLTDERKADDVPDFETEIEKMDPIK